MATKQSDGTNGCTVPVWLRLPDFDKALALARQRAAEEGWGFVPNEEFVARGAMRAGLDHLLGQPNETRVLAYPEPRAADKGCRLTPSQHVEKHRAKPMREIASHGQ